MEIVTDPMLWPSKALNVWEEGATIWHMGWDCPELKGERGQPGFQQQRYLNQSEQRENCQDAAMPGQMRQWQGMHHINRWNSARASHARLVQCQTFTALTLSPRRGECRWGRENRMPNDIVMPGNGQVDSPSHLSNVVPEERIAMYPSCWI